MYVLGHISCLHSTEFFLSQSTLGIFFTYPPEFHTYISWMLHTTNSENHTVCSNTCKDSPEARTVGPDLRQTDGFSDCACNLEHEAMRGDRRNLLSRN